MVHEVQMGKLRKRQSFSHVEEILDMLVNSHAGTYFMHESIDVDEPEKFSRTWFAWANSMFGELIFRLHEQGKLEKILEKL